MTKIIKVSMVVLMGSSMLYAGSDMMKKFEVKSGKIEYAIKGSGNIMGMVQIKAVGKKRVIFDDYGVKDLTEESKVTKETTMGQTKVKKEHTLKYMNASMIYSVDFKQKKILRMENPAMVMMAMMGDGKNVQQTGESMMKKMGGKKVGSDKVLGYACEVWDLMGVKQCMYKGIPLRIESDIMGLKSMEIATKAEFDVSLNNDDFELPDFPFVDIQGKTLKIDKNNLDEMDAKRSAKSSQEAEDGMKAMGAAMSALQESGFDMNSKEKMTPEQEQMMQKAMMKAMGGEKSMLAQTKQEIFEDVKLIPMARECFENANSVDEANACERKVDSEDPEQYNQWNDTIKTNMLKEMKMFEDALPCLKKAESFKALELCMPGE